MPCVFISLLDNSLIASDAAVSKSLQAAIHSRRFVSIRFKNRSSGRRVTILIIIIVIRDLLFLSCVDMATV